MDFFDAIVGRYSHRGGFTHEPVPREDLRRIMEAGLAAPSGGNAQTVSLIGVDDPALLRALGGVLKKPHFAEAPAAICVLSEAVITYGSRCFSVQDYSAAIENMLLAATAMGYASCWVEGYVTDAAGIGKRMGEILSVPEQLALVAYLPIGIPKMEGSPAKRKAFAERAWFNGYLHG